MRTLRLFKDRRGFEGNENQLYVVKLCSYPDYAMRKTVNYPGSFYLRRHLPSGGLLSKY